MNNSYEFSDVRKNHFNEMKFSLQNEAESENKQKQTSGFIKINNHYRVVSLAVAFNSYIKLLFFGTVSLLTQNKTSKHFKFKYVHEYFKFENAFFHLKMGGKFVGSMRNIGKKGTIDGRKTINTEEEREAALNLRAACEKRLKESHFSIFSERPFKVGQTKGICKGIQIDCARQYLIGEEGKPLCLSEIVYRNKKGASAEAAANQAVYQALTYEFSKEALYHYQLLQPLFMLAKKDEKTKLLVSNILSFLFVQNPDLRETYTKNFTLLDQQRSFDLKNMDEHVLYNSFSDALAKASSEVNREEQPNTKNLIAVFRKKIQKDPNLAHSLSKKELELVISSYELCIGLKEKMKKTVRIGYISNPTYRDLFEYLSFAAIDIDRVNLVTKARGIQVQSVFDKIGYSFFFKSDKEYIKQFKNLEPGYYGISFDINSKSSHAISYIKEPDGSTYILDPNKGAVRGKNESDTLKILNEIITDYQFEIWNVKKNHNIRVYKLEA